MKDLLGHVARELLSEAAREMGKHLAGLGSEVLREWMVSKGWLEVEHKAEGSSQPEGDDA